MHGMEEVGETDGSSDESLDVKSDKFDPLKALYSSKTLLPLANAQIYDNISKYEAIVTRGIVVRGSRKKNAELADSTKRRFLPHQEPVPRGSGSRGRRVQRGRGTAVTPEDLDGKNVLTRMNTTLGPLEMLLRCMNQRTQVKVYTRGARSIRGYVVAYVAAFDKHWNLALEDCLEVWTRKVKRKAPALGIPDGQEDVRGTGKSGMEGDVEYKTVVKESNGKTETVERHVPQMLLRGEQIAIIVKIDGL